LGSKSSCLSLSGSGITGLYGLKKILETNERNFGILRKKKA
jgi:hypothetical protein